MDNPIPTVMVKHDKYGECRINCSDYDEYFQKGYKLVAGSERGLAANSFTGRIVIPSAAAVADDSLKVAAKPSKGE